MYPLLDNFEIRRGTIFGMNCKCLFNFLFFTTFVTLSASRYGIEYSSEPSACVTCMNNKTCLAPDCFCCRDELRLPISKRDIPQIVFFTFDDALTDSATKFYHRLFNESRKNPNGCPISMTLFVSHHDTKYNNVNHLYRKGMEIAAHSVSHAHMSNKNFMKEAKNQKRNLATLGGVPENEIVGWRSPFLEPVGDMQPHALKTLGYTYDATLTYSKRSLKDKAPTPFTLDFGWPYDCKVKPCPKRRHFGFWEVPVVSLLDYLHKYDCVYVDGCNNPPPDESSAYKFLMDNFNSYHSKNRVPFGINMHPSWFYIPARLNAMDRFIQTLSKMDDVFIVSVKKMIDWLKSPIGLSQINTFQPWQCQNNNMPHNSHQSHNSQKQKPAWNRQSDAVTRRRNYIRARLEKIQAMRKQSQKQHSDDLTRLHHSNEARKKWWSHKPARHETSHVPARHEDIHVPKPTKPAAIAPWVHRRHDRPVKQNARRPMIIKTSPTAQVVAEVPFWKRKHKTNVSPTKQNEEVAWWEKAIPRTRSSKVEIAKKKELMKKEETENHSKHSMSSDYPVSFISSKDDQKKPQESLSENKGSHTVEIISANFQSPPKVYFKKQLKEQELKQQQIIEKQKEMQERQLKLQIEQLKQNNEKVFKKQKAEEDKRMRNIEQKHSIVLNKQQPFNMGEIINTKFKNPASKVIITTVSEAFDKITSTRSPSEEKFSLIADKNDKLDPWTRFVQFIIRNKP